ncbi:TetR/AcrR family transcriptional regulator [Aureimonas glaciei]|uniref:TetR family transcriptional regulator n=1 Tax=Aureimonas glaciei TaxID=1776957 RepID=A0A916V189_9HYPH|nr:TetR/AcrR family transcriptional regulator [Aureimonas glaciei]GGD01876.1 TetR family transcriptional regulator [Aureimonas glaciei]
MTGQDGFERVAQKRRTRAALLQATREILATGRQPSVPDAADHAGISRATAYRYFSKPEGMAQEALLDAIAAELENVDLAPPQGGAAARVEHVVSRILAMVMRNEALFRSYLGLVVSGESPARRGARRLSWLSEALAPVKATMAPAEFTRLLHALALVTGIETIVVLRDVCGLDEGDIDGTARWIARTLVGGATGG